MKDAGLKGELPSEWGQNFTKLQTLWLDYNELTGSLPESWGGMASLNGLHLYGNDLAGIIPESWVGMTSLNKLDLEYNDLSGNVPSWLSQLVSKNASVDLNCNYLTGPKPTNHSWVPSTWTGNCFDDSMASALEPKPCYKEFTCKQFMDVEFQALYAIRRAVEGESTNLTSWNTTSRGPCLDNWFGVTCDDFGKIIGLNMSSCLLKGSLPPNAFSKLTSLKSLDFSKNNLESPLPDFSQVKSLHSLNFSTNNLKEVFPISIFKLTNLVELRLDNNNFDGIIDEQISNLQLLEALWLEKSGLIDPLPKALASLTHLQILIVGDNKLQMNLPPEWGRWTNITYLDMHSANLNGELPLEWGQNFTKLQKLILKNNELTGSIPESWTRMKSLIELDMSCNYLTGTGPDSFLDSSTFGWKGNCFDDDLRGHEQSCPYDRTCAQFLRGEQPQGQEKVKVGAIVGGVIGAIVVLGAILGLVCWARQGRSKNRRHKRKADKDAGDWLVPQNVRRFTYREISKVTKSFDSSCEIGEGGFGKVYVARLDDGKHVAIKRASDLSFQGIKEFQNEITLLSRLHHRHLVGLEGFCDDRDEQILVYEYMSNGNLHHHLLDKHGSTLNWYRRLEIALAVAQGLEYLHTFANPPVIHRDVKPSNILLNENMIAKVADFGISKANPEMDTHVSTRPAGTAGYVDPEYFLRRQLTTASDVYGYGVVLLELITGQLAIDHKRLEDYNLVSWVKPKLVTEGIHAIIDPRLGPNVPAEQYEEVVHLAMGCTSFERGDRPTMQTVVSTLEGVLSSLVPPSEHLVPVASPSLSPLLIGKNSSSEFSGNRIEFSNVKADYETVEPR